MLSHFGGAGRLPSIDALRGVASLAVAWAHAEIFLVPLVPFSTNVATLGPVLLSMAALYGLAGVWLFFVISGFCIHMRWASQRAAGKDASVDFFVFWRRRIRRLYPAYLVALALYVAWNLLQPGAQLSWMTALDLVLHIFMLHNVDPHFVLSWNGVFWTLAVEEQLYLAYFGLLRLRVGIGWTRTLAILAALRVAWFAVAFALHRAWGIDVLITESAVTQWFTWALGALAVEHALGLVRLPRWASRGITAALALVIAAAGAQVLRNQPQAFISNVLWLAVEPLWGVGFFFLVTWVVGKEPGWSRRQRTPRAVVLLARVGLFSYSLYLMHEFVYWAINAAVGQGVGAVPAVAAVIAYLAGALVLSAAFFVLFERPFMSRPTARQPVRVGAGAEASSTA